MARSVKNTGLVTKTKEKTSYDGVAFYDAVDEQDLMRIFETLPYHAKPKKGVGLKTNELSMKLAQAGHYMDPDRLVKCLKHLEVLKLVANVPEHAGNLVQTLWHKSFPDFAAAVPA